MTQRLRTIRYRRRLTRAGGGIVFGGPHITIEGGRPRVGRGISIGRGCTIYDFCVLVTDDFTPRCGIEIGADTHINYGSYLCGTGGLTVGSHCLMGPGVKLIAANHRIGDTSRLIRDQGHEFAEIVVGDDVWLGASAVVLPGVTIGSGAVVAAGAVVVDDVAPFEVVAGVPARHVRVRTKTDEGADRE